MCFTTNMREDILNTKNEALAQIMDTDSQDELEDLRIAYLGRSGKITLAIKNIRMFPNKNENLRVKQLTKSKMQLKLL